MKKLVLLGLLGVIGSLSASEAKFLTHVENDSDQTMNIMIIPFEDLQDGCPFATTFEADLTTTMISIPPGEKYRLSKNIYLNPQKSNFVTIILHGTHIPLEDHDIDKLFENTKLVITKDGKYCFEEADKLEVRNSPLERQGNLNHE